jgi:hypothetical protein
MQDILLVVTINVNNPQELPLFRSFGSMQGLAAVVGKINWMEAHAKSDTGRRAG